MDWMANVGVGQRESVLLIFTA